MWTGNYQLFTNANKRVPVTEGIAKYDALRGIRFDAALGKETFVFYNLPTAFYLVNTTVSKSPTCVKFPCGDSCFKPLKVGGDGWRFNATVIVGLTKVEKWVVFSPNGRQEMVFIDQPTQSSGFKQCIPITNNAVSGTEEDNVLFQFGLWYGVKVGPVAANEFVPPAFCPSTGTSPRSLDDEMSSIAVSVSDHFATLNTFCR